MTPLETKISALLVDCETILEPQYYVAQKWVIINKSNKELRQVEDKKTSLAISYGRAREKITNLESYAIAKESYERDKVFSDGARLAGYWATFDSVLQYLIRQAGKTTKTRIIIDHVKALQFIRTFRSTLSSSHLKYEASARLFGVKPSCKTLSLPDGVSLHRLSMNEMNERMPVVQSHLFSGWEEQALDDHSAELRVSITVPVDHSIEGAFFSVHNSALQVATEIFSKVNQAILFSMNGNVKIGYIDLKGGIEQMPTGRSISPDFPPHINIIIATSDVPKIKVAYDLVSAGKKSDKTLNRSLHRFILGRRRTDLIDKLVDYVIAWEAILLTQNGTPITQELSYRFALNGSSIISSVCKKTSPKNIFKKLRSAYSTRSSVVHGGDDSDRDKALHSGGFNNLNELCEFLESNFRKIVFWLSSLKHDARPYRAQNGWESLIWSSDKGN